MQTNYAHFIVIVKPLKLSLVFANRSGGQNSPLFLGKCPVVFVLSKQTLQLALTAPINVDQVLASVDSSRQATGKEQEWEVLLPCTLDHSAIFALSCRG